MVVASALAHPEAILVVGDPGLVIRVDNEFVGSTTPEPGGLRVMEVRAGDRSIDVLEASRVVWPIQFGTAAVEEVEGDDGGFIDVAATAFGSLRENRAGRSDGLVRALVARGREWWNHLVGTDPSGAAKSVVLADAGVVDMAGRTRGSLAGTTAGGFDGFVRASRPDDGDDDPPIRYRSVG